MAYLVAAVIFVGALCFLDLLLSFAIIRRLRLQAGPHAAGFAGPVPGIVPPILPPGTEAPAFTAVTTAGVSRSLSDLAGQRSTIAFFAASCESCRAQLADFADYARSVPGGAAQVLAIVGGDARQASDIVAALDGPASIVIEPEEGPVATAFSVWGYPTFYALDERGRIVAGGMTVARLKPAQLV
jgi:peroxiredoxin